MSNYNGKETRHLYERFAYVLDYLPFGKPRTRGKFRAGPTVQLVGESFFTLLEANVKPGKPLKPLDRVYVGKSGRNEITYILGRIGYEELTANSKIEIQIVLEILVKKRETWFVDFFNNAQAITPRMHTLELIPGIGKKYMWDILNAREKRSFKNLDDLQRRVNIPNPTKLLAKRVVEELSGKSKYRLFTRYS